MLLVQCVQSVLRCKRLVASGFLHSWWHSRAVLPLTKGNKQTETLTNVTCSDKRVTKCRSGHSDWVIDTDRKCSQRALNNVTKVPRRCVMPKWSYVLLKYCKVVVMRTFRENGAERIYTALVEVDFCSLKCVLKSFIGQMTINGLWSVRIMW